MAGHGQRGERPVSVAIVGTRGYPSYYGGFETAVRSLAPHLAERGFDVRVYCRRGQTRLDDPALSPRVRRVVTPGLHSGYASTLTHGLTSTIHCLLRKPDVAVVMNVANGFWLPFLRMRGIKTLVNVDGIEWERAKWNPLGKALFRLGARLTAWMADQLVCDSVAIQDYWEHTYGRRGVFIPYGGGPARGHALPPGIEPQSYVLVVARFVPENSLNEFFDAVPELAQKHSVVMVGSDEGRLLDARARELSESHPGVHWLGQVSDDDILFALWENCLVYFHGHTVGGTNPALVQAMFCGARVVASDTVFNREVLGELGTFWDPSSQQGRLTDELLAAASEPWEPSAELIRRAEAEYSWPAVNDRYVQAVEELLVGQTANPAAAPPR